MSARTDGDGKGDSRLCPTRKSARRDAIARVLLRAEGPLTVNEILTAARRDVANLGIATVYRNIRSLLAAEAVRVTILPDGLPRYEAAERGHHHHFHCDGCGGVFDWAACPIALPPGAVPRGFRVTSHDVTLRGVCPRCGRSGGKKP